MGDAAEVAASLDAIGGVAAAAGRHQHAARLFGAASAMRDRAGLARLPWEGKRYEASVALARGGLAGDEFGRAFDEGRRLSVDEAVAQARKGRGSRTRGGEGWPSLTETERQVAALVAEGLTNRAIAERLFVSVSTVKSHLSHIFAKLGVARRSELAREVSRVAGGSTGNGARPPGTRRQK